jgi:hypothetical protein
MVMHRRMSFLGVLLLGLVLFQGCMSIPTSAVDPERYFKDQPTSHAETLYGTPYTGTWAPLFFADFDQIERLMLIDIADDPIYRSIEVQIFLIGGKEEAVVITVDRKKRIDYYYGSDILLDEKRRESVSTLLDAPNFHKQEVMASLQVLEGGLSCTASFTDYAGRPIFISIVESRPNTKQTAMLAPVSNQSLHPTSFPLVFLDTFNMVSRKGTQIELVFDGVVRKPAGFPLIVENRRVFYSRYAADVVVADLLIEGVHRIPLHEVASETAELRDGNATYHLNWERGYPELEKVSFVEGDSSVSLSFAPALPDLGHMDAQARAQGKFLLSVNAHPAVIAGTYDIAPSPGGHRLLLQPSTSWQPPFMGKKWVSTFLYTAYVEKDRHHVLLDARWDRI